MSSAGTRLLTVSIGATEYAAQVSKSVITSNPADADSPTFAETAAGGAREYRLELTILQDHATTTLWRKIWANSGTTAAVIVRPYGNTTPSTSQPHYTGNVTITEPDGDFIGGEADASTTSRWRVEVAWVFTAKPTEVTA